MEHNNDFKYQTFDKNEGKRFERVISWGKKVLIGIVGIVSLGYFAEKNPDKVEEITKNILNRKQ